MSENELVRTVYIVEKFIPARCPKCLSRFRSPRDYGMFAATQMPAKHFAEALAQQVELFPELGWQILNPERWVEEMATPPPRETGEARSTRDFIICNHCQNVTLRIRLGEEQVFTVDEAERLIESDGYTSCTEGQYSEIRR